jgi:NADPH:quinone reductase
MKAAYIDRVGPPECIHFGELPTPAVGPPDVLVKTTAVCVNPVDAMIRRGQLSENLPFPFVVGRDMAGVVQVVGRAVQRFVPGDRVWCNNQGHHGRQGTFADQVAVREDLLYPLPSRVDDKEAVAFVHSGLTACLGLQDAGLQSGEVLFINGGAGSVGSAVLQLGRGRGARVIVRADLGSKGQTWGQTLFFCFSLTSQRETLQRDFADTHSSSRQRDFADTHGDFADTHGDFADTHSSS